ncbi:MAG: DUF4872 domain-containing protein [Chloroflexi bacterium]|nr:DUF4872 domain-containing protein [Chloroflexota bacterium]
MPTLAKYRHFGGCHWETGSVHNVLAYRGVKAPHTGQPLSEALLMGVGGGLLMGYFNFAYEGYDPHVAILTRNTFDPLDTLLVRLGTVQHVMQTTNAAKGVKNLIDALENGEPVIAWLDIFLLPYNGLTYDQGWWGANPIVIYGYEADRVSIADRSRVALTVTPDELAAARSRIKKDKFKLLTIDPPDLDKLPVAVQQGIWDCLKRYVEAPVASAKNSFGFAALQRWADALIKPMLKYSWEREFPAGAKMYAGLTSTFERIGLCPGHEQAERDVYADFLDEASVILNKPALKEAAQLFRGSGRAWNQLACALLPDEVAPFKEARELLRKRQMLFVEQGGTSLAERQQISQRLSAIRKEMDKHFPLTAAEVTALRESLRDHVLRIHDLEREAHAALQAALMNGKK